MGADEDGKRLLISEIVKLRHETGLSQRQLAVETGVAQPVIARIEKGTASPQISTILKVLAPFGKTLAVVPLKSR